MSQTIRAQSGSYAPTQQFEVGGGTATQVAVQACTIFNFVSYQPPSPAPRDSVSIEDFVSRWERDPTRRHALAQGRRRLAAVSPLEDDFSIRALRLRAGMSQAQVAVHLGTSQPHIARIESGTLLPNLETLRKLARVFDVDLNTIDRAFPGGVDA